MNSSCYEPTLQDVEKLFAIALLNVPTEKLDAYAHQAQEMQEQLFMEQEPTLPLAALAGAAIATLAQSCIVLSNGNPHIAQLVLQYVNNMTQECIKYTLKDKYNA